MQSINHPRYAFKLVVRKGGKISGKIRYFIDKTQADAEFQALTTGTGNDGIEATRSITDSDKRDILEFKQAVKHWPQPVTVGDALRHFIKDHGTVKAGRTVQQAAEDHIEGLHRQKASTVHIGNTKCRLERFVKDFGPRLLANISREDLGHWLHSLELSPVSLRNYRLAINPLFADAVIRCEITANPLTGIKLPKIRPGKTEIWTPREAAKLLAHCPERSKAGLAIALFAGLRRSEVLRLQWSDIDLVQKRITVGTDNKTATRRAVRITDNLLAWLQPLAALSGSVAPTEQRWNDDMRRISRSSGISWKDNASRHSFCSYLLEITSNAAEVALQAGNSPQMIFKHYRELVSAQDAKDYFAIMPRDAEVISFRMRQIALGNDR